MAVDKIVENITGMTWDRFKQFMALMAPGMMIQT